MTADHTLFTSEIPEGRIRGYPLWRPQPRGKLYVLGVSESILGAWTHFCGAVAFGCSGNKDLCWGCRNDQAKRWRGYLGVIKRETSEVGIVEITQGAACQWRSRLTGGGHGVRGYGLTIYRRAAYARAPVIVEFSTSRAPEEDLPKPFDLAKALRTIWEGMTPNIAPPT